MPCRDLCCRAILRAATTPLLVHNPKLPRILKKAAAQSVRSMNFQKIDRYVCRLHIALLFLPNQHQYTRRQRLLFILEIYLVKVMWSQAVNRVNQTIAMLNQHNKASKMPAYRAREHNKTSQIIK